MKSNIYQIKFSGLWLGGKAIIKASSEQEAWDFLKVEWKSLEPISECRIIKLSNKPGILYFDSGDY